MMTWYSIGKNSKPDDYEWVLVSFLTEDSRQRCSGTCVVAALWEDDEGCAIWYDGNRFYNMHTTDRWAYIELPEE